MFFRHVSEAARKAIPASRFHFAHCSLRHVFVRLFPPGRLPLIPLLCQQCRCQRSPGATPPPASGRAFLLVVPRVGHDAQRCSTIQVHPNVSEAPHFRSSRPHPKTHFSKNKKGMPINIPIAQVHEIAIFEPRLAFRRFWVKEPRHSKNKRAEKCYPYRRTPPHVV